MVISSLSDVVLRELWESGTPLNSAWVEFSDSLDDFKWAALRTPPRKYQVIRDDPRYQQLEGWLPKTWKDRQYKLDITRTVERVNLLDRIYTGHLWAIGSQTLDNGFDELVRVPRELFFVDIERDGPFHDGVYWAKGQLTMDDESYFDIRVIQAPASGEPTQSSEDEENNTERCNDRSPGRPNTKDRIREKAQELLEADRDFRAMSPRIAQARELRSRLCGEEAREMDDLVGFKTTTITRIIGEVANERERSE